MSDAVNFHETMQCQSDWSSGDHTSDLAHSYILWDHRRDNHDLIRLSGLKLEICLTVSRSGKLALALRAMKNERLKVEVSAQ